MEPENQIKADCRNPGSNDVPSTTSFISVRSPMIWADTVATYLRENHSKIQGELVEGLLRLGYNGEYRLQAGFDEHFLRASNDLRPQVFLFLNEDLQHDAQSISRIISPIFAPHATVLSTKSQTYTLIEYYDLGGHDAQESTSSLSSAPSQQLAAASGQQSTQGSNQYSLSVNNHGDDQGKVQLPKGNGSEEQNKKGKGKTEQSEEPPTNYRRRLELHLDIPVYIECAGEEHEFNITTTVDIELRSNRSGDSSDWPEIQTIGRTTTPWCSINFKNIHISCLTSAAYSLDSLRVRMIATPFNTMCEDFFPADLETAVCTDIKSSQETPKTFGANATAALKPEAKLEMGREQVAREKTKAEWNYNGHSIKKSHLGTRELTIDYTRHRSEQEKPDAIVKRFTHLPYAVFVYQSDQGTRTMEISLQALWVTGSQKSHCFSAHLQGISSFPLHNNFLHQISVVFDLKELIDHGGDDLFLEANSAGLPERDVIQHGRDVGNGEEVFKKVEIQVKRNGESVPLRIPLHRGVIEALQGHVNPVKECKRRVMSPRD